MIWLRKNLIWHSLPIFFIIFIQEIFKSEAILKTAKIEEIPFSLAEIERAKLNQEQTFKDRQSGIYAMTNLERQRGFLHLFHIPYVLCFYAAKGKWPFIPPLMQVHVDTAAKTLFSHDDGFIKQFCKKWIQIKECFRPIFATATVSTAESLSQRLQNCSCTTDSPQVFFDRDHIGKVSAETILDTIDFLESFLPAPTKKTRKRKNRVRGRIDEINVE